MSIVIALFYAVRQSSTANRHTPKKMMDVFYNADLSAREKCCGHNGARYLGNTLWRQRSPRTLSVSDPLGMANEILDIEHAYYLLRHPIEDRSGH